MLILGIILLLVGWATGLGILYTIGEILLVVGLILLLLGRFGGADSTYGGRRYWF